MLPDRFEHGFGDGRDFAEAEAGGVFLVEFDGGENFIDAFFCEAGEVEDAAAFAGFFEGGHGIDAEFVVEGFDFLWAEALDIEEVENCFGELGAEARVELEFAGGDEDHDLGGEGFADALDLAELGGIVLGGFRDDITGVGFDDFGTGAVGADFEGVFSFQF